MSRLQTHGRNRAFSLIEVTAAIGLVAFSSIAILAMFPVAIRTSSQSRFDTLATLAVRHLVSELRASDGSALTIRGADHAIICTSDLSAPGSATIVFDSAGKPLATCPDYDAPRGGSDSLPESAYGLAQVRWAAPGSIGQRSTPLAITVSISAPASAPTGARQSLQFRTLHAP